MGAISTKIYCELAKMSQHFRNVHTLPTHLSLSPCIVLVYDSGFP